MAVSHEWKHQWTSGCLKDCLLYGQSLHGILTVKYHSENVLQLVENMATVYCMMYV